MTPFAKLECMNDFEYLNLGPDFLHKETNTI